MLCPATIALNRGNVPDPLMILLLPLAADLTVRAAVSGRLGTLVWAGVLVGLAFQAKMIEAWLVAPALALAYWLAADADRLRRFGRLGIAGLITAAVSLSWMVVVSLVPASGRPYVDGSAGNSIFRQVFVYNGFGRVDQVSPNQLLTKAIGVRLGSVAPGWDRLLSGPLGHDAGWLIPAALIALVACILASRREGSRLLRASAALWGTWLVVLVVVFSASASINPYYTAALSPPTAALLGTGAALAWDRRADPQTRALGSGRSADQRRVRRLAPDPAKVFGTVAGLADAVVVLGLAALLAVVIAWRSRPGLAIGLAAAAIVVAPALASASVVSNSLGPFDTPFESAGAFALARSLGDVSARTEALLPPLETAKGLQPDLMATQTSAVAAPFIYDSGQEVVPIGGFTGTAPEPSLTSLRAMIARGDFHLVTQSPAVSDPRLVWVADHCFAVPAAAQGSDGLRFAVSTAGVRPLAPELIAHPEARGRCRLRRPRGALAQNVQNAHCPLGR